MTSKSTVIKTSRKDIMTCNFAINKEKKKKERHRQDKLNGHKDSRIQLNEVGCFES